MTNITGTAGPDLLTGGDNGDILTGLGDSDTLFGTGDNDRLSGNAGGVGRDWYFDVGAVLDHVEATNHTFTADEIENIIASSAPLPPPGDLLTRRCAAGPGHTHATLCPSGWRTEDGFHRFLRQRYRSWTNRPALFLTSPLASYASET